MRYLLQRGTYKTDPLLSPTGFESCIKPEVKTVSWSVGKYAISRFKLSTALNRLFPKLCHNDIHLFSGLVLRPAFEAR